MNLKTHAKSGVVGGIMLPIALLLATLIANEGQALLGLNLDRVSLAIFLVPFLYGCAEVMKAIVKLETARFGKDLLGGLDELGSIFGGGAPPPIPVVPTSPPPPAETASPPPPPPSGLFRSGGPKS